MSAALEARWSDEAKEQLAALWAEGHAVLHIASVMGVSKSAVCGKRRRMGLPERASPIKPNSSLTAGQEPKPMPPRNAPDMPPEGTTPIGYARDLPAAKGCQWPIGDPKKPDFRFCGGKRITRPDGRKASYCAVHYPQAVVRTFQWK